MLPSLFPFIIFTDLLALDQSKTFYKPDWFDIVGAEVKCCKEAVCVIDMSSFTKFELAVSHNHIHIKSRILKMIMLAWQNQHICKDRVLKIYKSFY